MATREAGLRHKLRLPTTLIERVETPIRKVTKPNSKQKSKTTKPDSVIKKQSGKAQKPASKSKKLTRSNIAAKPRRSA
jgi:hypothetical protein